jgi:uncharacterized repeat protein (TIGR03803 family)
MNILASATAGIVVACGLAPQASHAVSPKTLYSFTQQSGWLSGGAFLIDRQGVMYGTAAKGGSAGAGTVFRFDPKSSVFTVLYNFLGGADGAQPVPGLVLDHSGVLYGATAGGGASGQGTVFQLHPSTGAETVLHSFGGAGDGAQPTYAPVLGQDGKLYGATTGGGAANDGSIYALSPRSGKESVVFSFDGANGQAPIALTEDASGIFYGVASLAGPQTRGLIFQFDPSSGAEADLFDFPKEVIQASYMPLTLGNGGLLYGSAVNLSERSLVFSLNVSTKVYSQIYSFGPFVAAVNSAMVLDSAGRLYGETNAETDYGEIFQLDPATGVETTIYTCNFNLKARGGEPHGLVFGKKGLLYGAMYVGGASYGGHKALGDGTIFSIKP